MFNVISVKEVTVEEVCGSCGKAVSFDVAIAADNHYGVVLCEDCQVTKIECSHCHKEFALGSDEDFSTHNSNLCDECYEYLYLDYDPADYIKCNCCGKRFEQYYEDETTCPACTEKEQSKPAVTVGSSTTMPMYMWAAIPMVVTGAIAYATYKTFFKK